MDDVKAPFLIESPPHRRFVVVEITSQRAGERLYLLQSEVSNEIRVDASAKNAVQGARQGAADRIPNPESLEDPGDEQCDCGGFGRKGHRDFASGP